MKYTVHIFDRGNTKWFVKNPEIFLNINDSSSFDIYTDSSDIATKFDLKSARLVAHGLRHRVSFYPRYINVV